MTVPQPTLDQHLKAALPDPDAGWSMGSFGAIAEFHHVAGDPAPALLAGCAAVSARGGVRLEELDRVTPIAWEALSPRPDRWQQGVALCLPAPEAAMTQRAVLTELGPDHDALRAQDRAGVLFDMGLDQPQVDFCIRTADPELLALLRAHVGRPVMAPGNPAMAAILKAHPHRVAQSRIGRVEVYQKIGGPDTGGTSPTGPHTHVLPKLLRARRSHSANMPIPEGLVPVAGFHPPSPIMGTLAEDRAFDPEIFAAFQAFLSAWGDPVNLAIKQRLWAALAGGAEPGDLAPPEDRAGRVAFRVALRQAGRREGENARLARWRAAYDRELDHADEDAPGH
ncbi:DUF6925 family protein [Paracoccus aminophilus]|uniref:Uncharacterized protein n=1 Tax=Paracoccus aminophilus JCM 7686 TaxID=1367847 RepID=S5Y7G3_PARAH|nr:hypothetical protein [Paracoccus aminophilus]AGT11460.1 hypothetical protein JCM7686_pAMI6p130 [Paracoccus aminophilus JCM 7686]